MCWKKGWYCCLVFFTTATRTYARKWFACHFLSLPLLPSLSLPHPSIWSVRRGSHFCANNSLSTCSLPISMLMKLFPCASWCKYSKEKLRIFHHHPEWVFSLYKIFIYCTRSVKCYTNWTKGLFQHAPVRKCCYSVLTALSNPLSGLCL